MAERTDINVRGRRPAGGAWGSRSFAGEKGCCRVLSRMLGSGMRALLLLAGALAGAEAALLGAVAAAAALRRRFFAGPPPEAFPWEDRPEVELESGAARLKLYPQYGGLYGAMLEEIKGARERIFVETFIWQDDRWGNRFVDALAEKAREGVAVYAVFDDLASAGQPEEFKRFPEPINLLRFRRVSGALGAVNPRSAHRDHRKLLTVDGRVAFVGGFNIGDLYTAWRDTHVRVLGPAAREVERAFANFWNTHRNTHRNTNWGGGRGPKDELPEAPAVRDGVWDPSTGLLVNDPYRHTLPIRDSYLGVIHRAEERVWLTTAYFTPGPAMREALVEAAGRGADVQVLFPRASNHAVVDWLGRGHVAMLLRGGVRIFVYEDFMLHAKTATVDGVWSVVGSANIDSLSLYALNETALEVYSGRFAAQMEQTFELDKTNATEITLKEWEGRPLHQKVVEQGLAPLRIFG